MNLDALTPKILGSRFKMGRQDWSPGDEERVLLDLPLAQLRRQQDSVPPQVAGFVLDGESEPEIVLDLLPENTPPRDELQKTEVRIAQLQTQHGMVEQQLKEARRERANMVARPTGNLNRLSVLDKDIARYERDASGLSDAIELLSRQKVEQQDAIRQAELAAARAHVEATTARRVALLTEGQALAAKAVTDFERFGAELRSSGAELRCLVTRIRELGGEIGAPSEFAPLAHTGKLRALIAAAREYIELSE